MTATDTPMDALQTAIRAEADLREKRRQTAEHIRTLQAELVSLEDELRTARSKTAALEDAERRSRTVRR